jgi:hypothetical protein
MCVPALTVTRRTADNLRNKPARRAELIGLNAVTGDSFSHFASLHKQK